MAFTFKLENPDGTPADPSKLKTAVPNWEIGDQIPLGLDRPETGHTRGGIAPRLPGRRHPSGTPTLKLAAG